MQIELITQEAIKTSAIEGEILERENKSFGFFIRIIVGVLCILSNRKVDVRILTAQGHCMPMNSH